MKLLLIFTLYMKKMQMKYILAGLILSSSLISCAQRDRKEKNSPTPPITQTPPLTNVQQTKGDYLDEVLKYVEKMYVDSVNTQQLYEAAIIGMLEQLDPHTSFIPKSEVDDANRRIDGSFVGIGIRYQILKDTLMVVETISGGPSEKLGMKAGDKIITIDGQNVAGIGLKNTQVREKLMGELGTIVKVEVKRKTSSKTVNYVITRDRIRENSVECAYLVAPKIGYIKLNSFSRSTVDEVGKAITELKAEGMESLIFDLQSNGGGLLTAAQFLADEFLSSNKLIVYSEGRAQPRQNLTAGKTGKFEVGNLILLTDENSASASEILSGAVQDWDRGLIVGRRTYGKGLVQRPIDLSDGSQMRLTIARYYTPSGRFIQKSYEDKEAYKNDYMRRFMNGEMTNLDSIKLPDSLKFETLITKRAVYGGGGIMPDVFVPLDTTELTDFYRDLSGTGIFNSFALTYVDKNRDDLNKKYESSEQFKKDFMVSDKFIKEMIDEAMKDNKDLKMDDKQYQVSKELIRIRMKATIANDLFGGEAFYLIYNEKNEILQKAISILEKNDYYNYNLERK